MATGQGDVGAITQIVTMTVKPEHEEEFLEFADRYISLVEEGEPGTSLYVLTKHPERDQTYVWVERYDDQEALQLHSDAPSMADAMATLEPWWSEPPELLVLSQVSPG